jgi:hypothetical protein
MIRWNKWTRDYTYTYEWHDGMLGNLSTGKAIDPLYIG